MARTVTLADLRTRALELAHRENDDPDVGFVTTAEVNGMVNASLGQWHGYLAKAVPERFEAEDEITANGSASYPLPDDYYESIGVDYQLSDTTRAELRRLMLNERNDYSTTPGAQAVAYRVKGNVVVLLPTPDSGTYYHVYVTAAPVLEDDADAIDGVNGWEEWVVYDVTVKILMKEQSTEAAAQFIVERDKIRAAMFVAAAEREAGQPSRVVDTRIRRRRRNQDPDFWFGRE